MATHNRSEQSWDREIRYRQRHRVKYRVYQRQWSRNKRAEIKTLKLTEPKRFEQIEKKRRETWYKWYSRNRDKVRAYNRERRQKLKFAPGHEARRLHRNALRRAYVKKNPEHLRTYWHDRQRQLRQEALNAYGNRCVCCNESVFEFLTIDHVNNDGAQHRKQISAGGQLYAWLKKHNYPTGFQVLCYNCNCAKGAHGSCPHQRV